MRSAQVAHTARDLHFNQTRESNDRQAFDLLDVQIADRFRDRNFRSLSRFLAGDKKLNGNSILCAELGIVRIPDESYVRQDLTNRFTVIRSNDKIHARRVSLIADSP